MSIKSSAFGVTKLTNKDSKKFLDQVTYGRPNKAARQSLEDGRELLKKIQSQGSAKHTFK
jgi:hypothetical protein